MKPTHRSTTWTTCATTGKRGYETRKLARTARRQARPTNEMNIYTCHACGLYHVGHMPDEVRRGELDKDTWQERIRTRRRS